MARLPSRILGPALLGAAIFAAAWFAASSGRFSRGSSSPVASFIPGNPSHLALATAALSRPERSEQAHALENLLAGKPFVLVENGQPIQFRLSLHEVYLPAAPAGQRVREITPAPDPASLVAQAASLNAERPAGWVLYPTGQAEDPSLRRILHTRLLLKIRDGKAARTLLEQEGLKLIDEPSYAPGMWIVEVTRDGPTAALEALKNLEGNAAIAEASPLLLHRAAKKLIPNDPFFAQQWHLRNTARANSDLNVANAWNTVQGAGVRIAIIDDGLDTTHPDLASHVDTTNDYDWNEGDTDPTPNPLNDDFHGTAVAGIAAAAGNNGIGVSGVAPQATLVGFRLLAGDTTDAEEADAMSRGNDIIAIKNNSWGDKDGQPWIMYSPGTLFSAARKNAVLTGRGGLGTIFVWAAGNGRLEHDQGNKDRYSNSMYSINVGASTDLGTVAAYSETGAHLTAVAPSSGGTRATLTTDLTGSDGYNSGSTYGELADANYTKEFGGTSSAAPAVAGAVALMLEANPALSWRDVKEILLRSSKKLVPTDAGWTSRPGGFPSLPPIKHHHSYGGGLVDADAAVNMARTWTVLPSQTVEVSRAKNWDEPYPWIPDNSSTGITIPLDFSDIDPMRVEHVTITVNIPHPSRGDLDIRLRSPSGVESVLATMDTTDSGDDYYDWTFSSMRHWGESAKGVWTLYVKDLFVRDLGRITSAKVTLYGTQAEPVSLTSQTTGPVLLAEGNELNLEAVTTGFGEIENKWRRSSQVVSAASNYHVASATTAHAGTYDFSATNLTGAVNGVSVPVGVVRMLVPGVAVKEGLTATFKVTSGGPGLNYQWYRGATPVVNDVRITGAQTATLTVKKVVAGDDALYTCRVAMAGSLDYIETTPAALSVILKPVLIAPSLSNGIVSGPAAYQFAAENGATRFTASGLPPGMTINSKDGTFSGRPSRAGTYHVKVTAYNAAGSSEPVTVTWTIEPFPPEAKGTYNGLIDRDGVVNGDLGGRFRMVVASAGTISGSLTLGAKTHSFSGRLDTAAGNTQALSAIHIVRPRPLAALNVDFALDLTTGIVTGSVDDGAGRCLFSALRNPWSSANKALALAGRYNSFLEAAAETEDDANHPQGQGYAVLMTTATGTATWSGKLSDGSLITGSTTFSGGGQTPLHLMLYTNTGSIQGWSTIAADAPGNFDGTLGWWKAGQPSNSRTRSYKDGFTLHTLTVIGARYIKPAVKTMVLNLPAPVGSEPNARLGFLSGGLHDNFLQDFTVTTANAVRMPAGAANPQLVRLTLTPTTGLINGSFTIKDSDPTDLIPPIATVTRTASFSGVLVTREGYGQGRGFFLLPMLPADGPPKTTAYTSPILSGRILLESTPTP